MEFIHQKKTHFHRYTVVTVESAFACISHLSWCAGISYTIKLHDVNLKFKGMFV